MNAMLTVPIAPAASKLRSWLVGSLMNQSDLARELGCGKSAVSLWLSGRQRPSRGLRRQLEVLTDGAVKRSDWRFTGTTKVDAVLSDLGYRFPGTRPTLLGAIRDSNDQAPLAERTEACLQARLLLLAQQQGVACRPQVHCSAGYVDIVDEQFVYEIKLDGDDLACAVGQAVLYAAALKRKPGVIMASHPRKGQWEAAHLAGIAVEVFP